MAERIQPDKNLQNVVDELEQAPVNSHQAQQMQQQKNDRNRQDRVNHTKPKDYSNR